MAVTRADLVDLYLAYFGRPPDISGLDYYTTNPSATLASVAAAFSASPESQALYGLTFGNAQINAIYQNLFNRDAEPAGLTYWTAEVVAGRISPAGAALAILQGAQNLDKVSVANKVLVSSSFLAQLDTPVEMAGYSGTAAAASARAFLHLVDSSADSLATATADLAEQVSIATGQGTLDFTVTKSAANVVSFSHAGTAIAVTASGGTFTFTTSGGTAGTGTATGTIAGIAIPEGTTLTISSTLAGSKAFTGSGTALVIASAAGEDLSVNLTATGVSAIQLTSGHNYTLTATQAAIAKIGAAGTLGTITDTATMTVVGTLAQVGAGKATALKSSGADIVVASLMTGLDISGTSMANVDKIELASGQNYTMTAAQSALITAAPGAQTITLSNAAVGLTLNAAVETFKLGNFSNIVTMGAVGQVVTGGTGADTVTAINGVTSSSDLKAGANVVVVTSGSDVSGGTFTATGGSIGYNINAAATATLNLTQLAAVTSATGTQNIKLSEAATALSLNAAVETITLGNFANSVTMGAVGQVVVGGTLADTVTAITGVTSSSDLKGGANVVVVTNGANLSAGTFTATGGTLGLNVNAAATATLSAAQAAAISSATGTQHITLSNAAASLALNADVETFTLANATNSVTMGAVGQVVVGDAGADTVTAINGVASSSDLKAGANVVVVTNGSNITGGTFSATGGTLGYNVDAAATATLTAAQAALISSATGTQNITVSNAAAALSLHAGVETFTLGNFANTVTLGAVGQNVTGGTGADTFTVGALAAAGILNGADGTADQLNIGGTLGAATISNFEILNVTATSNIAAANAGATLGTATLTMSASTGLSMTTAQNATLAGSATVAGAGQSVTLTDAGTNVSIAGIETYVLATGDNNLTTGTAGQTVNANALADGDLLTLSGGFDATVTLVAGDLDATIAGTITLTATTGSNAISTGFGNDFIDAGSGNDTVDAGEGNDTVIGGDGSDSITLGLGTDVFVFSSLTGTDAISDFDVADDMVHLSKAVFTGLGAIAALDAGEFESGAGLVAAATAAGRVVYDTTTGDLYYDVDGDGAGAAVLIGTFTGTPALSAAQFTIIA